MNISYKSIFNNETQSWVAVSEVNRTRGKRSKIAIGLIVTSAFFSSDIYALENIMYGDGGSIIDTNSIEGVRGVSISSRVGKDGARVPANLKSQDSSVVIGASAGLASTNFNSSVMIGSSAGVSSKNQVSSVIIGPFAGLASSGGKFASNVFVGEQTGSDSNGVFNSVYGAQAGTNLSGNRNTVSGYTAGQYVAGQNNSFFGYASGVSAKGNSNVAVGFDSGARQRGLSNVAVGASAGKNLLGDTNNAFGVSALQSSFSNNSVAIGSFAGHSSSGDDNIFIGRKVGEGIRVSQVTSVGALSLAQGQAATAFGANAKVLYEAGLGVGFNALVEGIDGVALGRSSHALSIGKSGSVAVGAYAKAIDRVKYDKPISATAIGYNATSYDASTALGATAYANMNSTSLGSNSYSDKNSIAVGDGATSYGLESVAVGNRVYVGLNASNATVLGQNASVGMGSVGAMVLGSGSRVADSAMRSSAIGYQATTSGTDSLAIGTNSLVSGNLSVAVGYKNIVSGNHSGAFGDPNTILSNRSFAVGNDNSLSVDNSFVLGNNLSISEAGNTVNGNVVLGNLSADKAYAQINSATIGETSVMFKANGSIVHNTTPIIYRGFAGLAVGVVSVGDRGAERQLVNVAPGTISGTSTDAINGSQLYTIVLGLTDNIAVVANNIPTISTLSTHYQNIASAKLVEAPASAIATKPLEKLSKALSGSPAVVIANQSVAIGDNADATAQPGDVALGADSMTSAVIGTSNTTILGNMYSFAGVNPTSTVSVGSVGSERTVTNVAAGVISARSTHAVNGSQLYATNAAIDNLVIKMMGNETHYYSVNDDGQQQANYANDGATGVNAIAVGAVATAVGVNGIALGYNAQAKNANSVALGANSVSKDAVQVDNATIDTKDNSYTYSGFAGAASGTIAVGHEGADRQAVNVASGAITATSTDGINGSQLYAIGSGLNQRIDNVDARVTNAENNILNVDRRINNIDNKLRKLSSGVASAMAMGEPEHVAGQWTGYQGVGVYDGEVAFAASFRRTAHNGRWSVLGGVSYSSQGIVGAKIGATQILTSND